MIKEIKNYSDNTDNIKSKKARIKILEFSGDTEKIKKVENEITLLEKEIKKVDIALEALCDEDRFIIQKKYIDKLSWIEVEVEFNDTFLKRPPVTWYALRKNSIKIERLLKLILAPERESVKELDLCVNA